MIANSRCIACILQKQEEKIRQFTDEEKKKHFIHDALEILHQYGLTDSQPIIGKRIQDAYEAYFEETVDYVALKHKYNQYMLEKEEEIRSKIYEATDSMASCIKYVCAGNYIDFGAMKELDDSLLHDLIEKNHELKISSKEVEYLKRDLQNSQKLLYITDNCGEIVMDKIFIQMMKERYPHLDITLMVRGGVAYNDATIEDVMEVGLDQIVPVIDNGCAMAGVSLSGVSKEAKSAIHNADLIISKGQANFESLYEEGVNPYFFFLCKCELFAKRFRTPLYGTIFSREERMDINF